MLDKIHLSLFFFKHHYIKLIVFLTANTAKHLQKYSLLNTCILKPTLSESLNTYAQCKQNDLSYG